MRLHRQIPIMFIVLLSFFVPAARSQDASPTRPAQGQRAGIVLPPSKAALAAEYGKLPLTFEVNQGQSDPQVRFLSRGNGYSLFLTSSGTAVLALSKPDALQTKLTTAKGRRPPARTTDVIRMELRGAASRVPVTEEDRLPGTANYFLGSDPSKWHSSIPTYGAVRYANVYPGVDLRYYGNQRQLEYDFVVAPNADPKPIRLHFAGARQLRLTSNGDLQVVAKDGEIAFHKPVVYQNVDGVRQPVTGQFSLLARNTATFSLGTYDRSRELVIDPTLAYSTYLGGTSVLGEHAFAIAVDAAGYAYVTGSTFSTDFPTTSDAFQTINNHGADGYCSAFVSKLNQSGTALVYSTYLGGTNAGSGGGGLTGVLVGGDYGTSIAVDASGDAYVAGGTGSKDFPVTSGAFQTTNNDYAHGDNAAFVTKLNSTGTALVYSTYLGGGLTTTAVGDFGDVAYGIAVDGSGTAYVTGQAGAGDFPVTSGAFQTTKPGRTAVFVTKFNSTGSSLVYSTLIAGTQGTSGGDAGFAIAIDQSGNAYVTGYAYSDNFPTTPGAIQSVNNSGNVMGTNAIVLKLNAVGTALLYSTYLGGTPPSDAVTDSGRGIAIDSQGDAFVTGEALSATFPVTTGAFQTTNKGYDKTAGTFAPNAFVAKVNPAGTALIYSTFLGGSGNPSSGDVAYGIGVDQSGDAFVTGGTGSADFPVTSGAFQTVNKANPSFFAVTNAFVTELNPTGSGLIYSTFFGGSGDVRDTGWGIVTDGTGNVYFAGDAWAEDFPVTPGAFKTKLTSNLSKNAFVAKFAPGSGPAPTATPQFSPSGGIYASSQTVTITDSATGATIYYTMDGSTPTTSSTKYTAPITVSQTTTINAIAAASGYLNSSEATATYTIQQQAAAIPTFSPVPGTYSSAQSVTLSDATTGATIYYTTDGSMPTTSSTKYTSPIAVAQTTTINAMAVASGYANSNVATGGYTIRMQPPPTAPTPAFSPAAGTYSSAQTLTISDTLSGATIYYTTDGSTPTTSSTKYTTAITVSATETLKAIAAASGYTNSAVASANYTINLPAADFAVSLSATTMTVTGGQSGTTTVSITPQNDFSAAVTLACSGLPSDATCVFSPATVTPSGAAANSTITVTTTTADASLPPSRSPFGPAGATLAVALCCFGLRRRRTLRRLLMLAVCMVGIGWLGGCGGASGSTSNPPPPTSKTYNVVVTATSGSLSHASTLIVTVNQ